MSRAQNQVQPSNPLRSVYKAWGPGHVLPGPIQEGTTRRTVQVCQGTGSTAGPSGAAGRARCPQSLPSHATTAADATAAAAIPLTAAACPAIASPRQSSDATASSSPAAASNDAILPWCIVTADDAALPAATAAACIQGWTLCRRVRCHQGATGTTRGCPSQRWSHIREPACQAHDLAAFVWVRAISRTSHNVQRAHGPQRKRRCVSSQHVGSARKPICD